MHRILLVIATLSLAQACDLFGKTKDFPERVQVVPTQPVDDDDPPADLSEISKAAPPERAERDRRSDAIEHAADEDE